MQLFPHSLTGIRAFNAAAKHLSCSRAAEELFLTQSAVSKNLQSLEEYLGVKLFTRVHQGLVLTDAGTTYWEAIKPVLSMLADATEKARMLDPDHAAIYLGVQATFGEKWLMRRIGEFARRYPDVVVQFAPRPGATSERTAFSAEIRAGRGTWNGMHAHYLMGQELFLVCSPALASGMQERGAAELLRFRLLEHVDLPQMWDRWFSAQQVRIYDGRNTQRYERFSVMISALLAGLGIALMARCLIEEELREGTLILLVEQPMKTEYGYYLVYPRDQYPSIALERFSDWLLETCAESTAC
ncbi:MAG: hypothetical protein A3I66_16005 [Burkholderiales bacterium RIFCSPLOWO2_02_FULL_57_36]|nr:MAG: hypothetical protein A3I66_16005 [Burkholderiales bacterium RIFCSPLOWO2_02_FULL_57_36]